MPNLIHCPDCRGVVSLEAPACPHCGRPLGDDEEFDTVVEWTQKPATPWYMVRLNFAVSLALLAALLFLLSGFFRIFHGRNMSPVFAFKGGYSFKDTVVNIDDITSMPAFAAQAQHPAAVRQAQELGILESEAARERRIQDEVDAKMQDIQNTFGP